MNFTKNPNSTPHSNVIRIRPAFSRVKWNRRRRRQHSLISFCAETRNAVRFGLKICGEQQCKTICSFAWNSLPRHECKQGCVSGDKNKCMCCIYLFRLCCVLIQLCLSSRCIMMSMRGDCTRFFLVEPWMHFSSGRTKDKIVIRHSHNSQHTIIIVVVVIMKRVWKSLKPKNISQKAIFDWRSEKRQKRQEKWVGDKMTSLKWPPDTMGA